MYLKEGKWFSIILEGNNRFIAKIQPEISLDDIIANDVSMMIPLWHRAAVDYINTSRDPKNPVMSHIIMWDAQKWATDGPTMVHSRRIVAHAALLAEMERQLNEQAAEYFKEKSGLSLVQDGVEKKI